MSTPTAGADVPMVPRRYLSPADVSETLGIPLSTIYRWQSDGTGPRFAKFGRHVRYLEADVTRFFEERLVA